MRMITLPLPPRELSPNARPHWAVKARAVKAYRGSGYVLARHAMGRTRPRWVRARAQATFYLPDRRKRDRDNLLASLKPAFDGFADAGLIADDSGLTHLPVVVALDREDPRVEITVEPD